jgi:hypothetical protein
MHDHVVLFWCGIFYINMCIGHAKIWFIEEKIKNPPITIFAALTDPVTTTTTRKKPIVLSFLFENLNSNGK